MMDKLDISLLPYLTFHCYRIGLFTATACYTGQAFVVACSNNSPVFRIAQFCLSDCLMNYEVFL